MINPRKSLLGRLSFSLVYVFLYLPILLLIIYSFNKTPLPNKLSAFTLEWYKELFNYKEVWVCFSNSMFIAIMTTFICLFFSLLLIYYKTIGGKIRKIIPLFYGNLMIPDTVLAISLACFFALCKIPLGLTTIIITHSVVGLGLSIPLIYLRFKDLNPSLLEASSVLGASSWTTFKRIVLPFMMPSLLGTGLMIFILSFDDYILTYFTAGSSAQTLSLFLVASLRFGISPMINSLTTILLLFSIGVVALLFLLKRKEELEKC
ncbi:MAG: hypothetical protein S4CHLAM20_04690 [Chlamydiia bacterium]|nr:hypothetical protein [Chlamydiia bacterium]